MAQAYRNRPESLQVVENQMQSTRDGKSVIDSAGKAISKNRASQLKREDNVKEINVGLYDIDEAIYYYFEIVLYFF